MLASLLIGNAFNLTKYPFVQNTDDVRWGTFIWRTAALQPYLRDPILFDVEFLGLVHPDEVNDKWQYHCSRQQLSPPEDARNAGHSRQQQAPVVQVLTEVGGLFFFF